MDKKEQGLEVREQIAKEAAKPYEETQGQPVRSLSDILGQAEKAYAAYMEAEQQVARIYKENEDQVSKEYSQAEQLYTMWQPRVMSYHGEYCIGYQNQYNYPIYVWIDQNLKENMLGKR